jgi:hypothetical protein
MHGHLQLGRDFHPPRICPTIVPEACLMRHEVIWKEHRHAGRYKDFCSRMQDANIAQWGSGGYIIILRMRMIQVG